MGRRETMLHHFIEQRDETDARVAEGIERNRKGQARVRVLDEKGRPVKGARVTAKQTGHDFQFGGSLNDLDQLGSEEKNRLFTTLDLFPTTLAAMGVEIEGERLGLGTNLFSGEKTLPEKYGYEKMFEELKKKSLFYDNEILYP